MTDKKLTDNEIVKALEWLESKTKEYCEQCDYKNSEVCDICIFDKIKLALDLINRLQAENERLEKENEEQYDIARDTIRAEIADGGTSCHWCEDIIIGTAKAEAYKECIEKVKEEIKQALDSNYKVRAERIEKHNVGETDDFISYCGGKIDCLRGLDDFLDNLLKEMVGEDNA